MADDRITEVIALVDQPDDAMASAYLDNLERVWKTFVISCPIDRLMVARMRYAVQSEDSEHFGPLVREAARMIVDLISFEIVKRQGTAQRSMAGLERLAGTVETGQDS